MTGAAMTYGRLSQTHPKYDAERMQELHDLYAGGYTIAKNAKKYLPTLVNETGSRYSERLQCTAYRPYFGQIVEQFASELFGQPLNIIAAADKDNPNTPGDPPDEFYNEFEADCDMRGTPFVDLVKVCATNALVQRWAYVCIDAPDDDGPPPANLADEDERGMRRLYAYEISPRQVIDWKEDDCGGYAWLIVHKREQERVTPRDSRESIRETFTVWTMDAAVAFWERYVVEHKDGRPPRDEDVVQMVASGRTTFKRIPVVRLQLPKGLWVGNKIGPQAKEHWQRRSALNAAENRSMVAIPFIGRASEIGAPGGALPSDTQQDETRGRNPVGKFNSDGWAEIGADDKLGFAEPEGKCYALVDKQLDADKDEMFRVNHQMAASVKNTPSSLGRSGLSKQKDGEATAKVLRALGREVRQFALMVYRTISEARGDDVVWTANGLDNYEITDRESVLEESISIDQVSIPSETFKKTHKKQVARKLLSGVDPRTWDTIDNEIDDGVESEHELAEIKQDAEKDAVLNPEPPPEPVVSSLGVKTTTVKAPKVLQPKTTGAQA